MKNEFSIPFHLFSNSRIHIRNKIPDKLWTNKSYTILLSWTQIKRVN